MAVSLHLSSSNAQTQSIFVLYSLLKHIPVKRMTFPGQASGFLSNEHVIVIVSERLVSRSKTRSMACRVQHCPQAYILFPPHHFRYSTLFLLHLWNFFRLFQRLQTSTRDQHRSRLRMLCPASRLRPLPHRRLAPRISRIRIHTPSLPYRIACLLTLPLSPHHPPCLTLAPNRAVAYRAPQPRLVDPLPTCRHLRSELAKSHRQILDMLRSKSERVCSVE